MKLAYAEASLMVREKIAAASEAQAALWSGGIIDDEDGLLRLISFHAVKVRSKSAGSHNAKK